MKELEKGIGPYDAICIMGLNRHRPRIEVFYEKIGKFKSTYEKSKKFFDLIEPVIRNEFSRITGIQVVEEEKIQRHPEYPFMVGVIKYQVEEDGEQGYLEIREVSEYKRREWEEDNIPLEYIFRTHHNMIAFDFSFAYIAVLIGGNTLKIRKVEREEVYEDTLLAIEEHFWGLVKEGKEPPLDGSDASAEWLRETYPVAKENSAVTIEDESVAELVKRYKELEAEAKPLKEKLKPIEDEMNEISNQLKTLLKDNEFGYIGNHVVEWKNKEVSFFDRKSFEKEHPELFKKYYKKRAQRVFKVI